MGVWKFVYYSIRNFFIFFSIVTFIPSLPPSTHFNIESFTITPLRPIDAAPNNYLDNAERLLAGRVHGPEHLITNGKDIYASVFDAVVKINGDHITHVAKFGQPCESFQPKKCGRPLGLAFDTISDNLIVADAYYGIWSVNPKTGDKKQLVSPNVKLDGKISRDAKIFNSVAVSKTGDIYWSDSSSDFYLEDGVLSFLANPSGRLFRYDRTQKLNVLLIDNIYFANGVALSPNEDFVVVSETAASQIKRFYLKGSKAGTTDIFLDGIPGMPDNLTPDSKGLWVPLIIARSSDNPALWQSASQAPLIRKFLLRFFTLLELPFKAINELYPNSYSQIALHYIGNFASVTPFTPSIKTVLRVDWNGNIEYALQGKDKSVVSISHVMELDNYLYLGSFDQAYLSRIKLPSEIETGGGSHHKPTTTTQKPSTTPKPTTTTTTTPKPTTTTPKPTTTTSTTTPKPATTTSTTTPQPITTTSTTTPQPTTTTSTTTPQPTTTTTTTTTPRPTTTEIPLRPAETPNEEPASFSKTNSANQATPNDAKDSGSTASTSDTKTESSQTTGSESKTEKPIKPAEPAPIYEERPTDTKQPEPEKLKIIKKGGAQGEF